jgi:hypothetical protein
LEDVAELDGSPVEVTLLNETQGTLIMLFGTLLRGLAGRERENQAQNNEGA